MLSTTWMTFAPGWRWMLTMSAGGALHPGGKPVVLRADLHRARRRCSLTGAPLR